MLETLTKHYTVNKNSKYQSLAEYLEALLENGYQITSLATAKDYAGLHITAGVTKQVRFRYVVMAPSLAQWPASCAHIFDSAKQAEAYTNQAVINAANAMMKEARQEHQKPLQPKTYIARTMTSTVVTITLPGQAAKQVALYPVNYTQEN